MASTHGVTIPKGNMPDFIVSATAAITYVTDPEIWPQFMAWLAENHPDAGVKDLAERREVVAVHAHLLLRAWASAS